MLMRRFHTTYIVDIDELLSNFEYILKYNNKAAQMVTVKRGNKVIALLLPSDAVEELSNSIEKLERQHKRDKIEKKELEKTNAILEARLGLQEKTNKDDFPFK